MILSKSWGISQKEMGSRCKGKISWSSLFMAMYLCQGHASLNSWFNQVRLSVRSTVTRIYSEHYLEQQRMYRTSVCLFRLWYCMNMPVGTIFTLMSVCLSVCICNINFWNTWATNFICTINKFIQIDYIFSLVCLWISVCLFGLHVINHLPRTSDIFTILRSSLSAKVTKWRSRSREEKPDISFDKMCPTRLG